MLGIDQSRTGFGFVALDGNDHAATAIGNFPGKDDWTPLQRHLQLGDIEDWFSGVLAAYDTLPIGAICMEGYNRNAMNGREESGELAEMVRRVVWRSLGRFPIIASPGQVKKFATGKGTAKKEEILLAVYKRWGFDTTDNNLADAFAIAKLAQALCQGEWEGLTAPQKEVLTALGTDSSWRLTREQLQQIATLPASKRGATLSSLMPTSSGSPR